MRRNIRALLADPESRQRLLNGAARAIIEVGRDGTHVSPSEEVSMTKTMIESRPMRRVKSADLFDALVHFYGVDRLVLEDSTLGDVTPGTYYLTTAKPETTFGLPSTPEEWDACRPGSVCLDAIFTDLLKHGLVDEGDYIITVGW